MKKKIFALCITLIILATSWVIYKKFIQSQSEAPVKTQKPEKRDIKKTVLAEGFLEASKTSKIGSLITAKVLKIHVTVGQKITKNALLAELENDKGGDADLLYTEGLLEQSKASLDYTAANYHREKTLFDEGERSQEAFDKVTELYKKAVADVKIRQAAYNKELFLFTQTQIHAPHDGTVIAINVEEGETVNPTSSPPKILFEIAQDLTKMKATIYIDENKIGDVNLGMPVDITVDTYPDRKPWQGIINFLSLSRAEQPAGTTAQQVVYKASMPIDNTEGLLRSGMTIHAKIAIAHAKQVLTVPGLVFQLNKKALATLAQKINFTCKPLAPDPSKNKAHDQDHTPSKTLWVFTDKTMTEKRVKIGITDNSFFQVLDGITANDEVIIDDMTASEELKKLAQRVAG